MAIPGHRLFLVCLKTAGVPAPISSLRFLHRSARPQRSRWRTGLAILWLSCVGSAVTAEDPPEEVPIRFADAIPALGGRNLVPNGSFEAGKSGWSSLGRGVGGGNDWTPLSSAWGNFTELHGQVELGGGAHGGAFLRIRLGGEQTPVFATDYFQPVHRRELRPLAASVGWIEVTPGQPYTLSLSLRASREGLRAAFGLATENPGRGWPGERAEVLHEVILSTAWRRYEHTFIPAHRWVFVLAGPHLAAEETAAVDVDAVQLEPGDRATDFVPRAGLEIGVVASAPAGVFTGDESAALLLGAANHTDEPVYARFNFRVTDYFDRPVELTEADLEIPARSAAAKRVPLPRHWRGYYRIATVCRHDGTQMDARAVRVAIVPARDATNTIFGVNHAYASADLLELARKAGVDWYRDWSLKWQQIEPSPGRLQWDVSDPQIDRLAARQREVVGLIPFPSTDWNSTALDLATLRRLSPRHGAGGSSGDSELLLRARWAWPPAGVAELTRFIGQAVDRYRDRIRVWEFLNEPLFTLYALPNDRALRSPALKGHAVPDYLALLQTAATAIRAAQPGARIIAGGMAPDSPLGHELIAGGLLRHADIVGLHDYPAAPARRGAPVRPPEALLGPLDKLRATMRDHGGMAPLWLTEFSYYGDDDRPRRPFIPIPELWSEPQLLSERQAADYTIRYATLFLSRGGERIFLHSGCTGSVNRPGTESCLFTDGAVRKAFPALAVFNRLLGSAPRFVADRSAGTARIVAFETGDRSTLVLWDPEEAASVTVPAGVVSHDLMGRPLPGKSIRLTASPVYWTGRSGEAGHLLESCTVTPGPTPAPARRKAAPTSPDPESEY